MVLNKHGSFYMRSGWGTKIQQAVNSDAAIFTPANEQDAIDALGLGRVMIKALRYWSDAMGLTCEKKEQNVISKYKTPLYEYIDKYDPYFQKVGTLALLHRNIANNFDEATAWYWLFNEWSSDVITNDSFTEGLHAFVAVNGMNVKRDAVNKEFNCVKNTYVGDKTKDKKKIMDEDTYPFFGPLHILKYDGKHLIKNHLTARELPVKVLVYSIADDNRKESINHGQVGIDTLLEGKCQVGRYFNIRYTDLIDMLIEAENKGYIALNNNFGNRLIEFNDTDYDALVKKYFSE